MYRVDVCRSRVVNYPKRRSASTISRQKPRLNNQGLGVPYYTRPKLGKARVTEMAVPSYHGHAIASAPRSALPRRRRRRAALGLRGGRHLSLPYCPPHNRSRPSVAALPAVLTVLSLSALVLPIRLCAARGGRTGAAGQYTLPSTPPPHNTFIRPAVVLARPSIMRYSRPSTCQRRGAPFPRRRGMS